MLLPSIVRGEGGRGTAYGLKFASVLVHGLLKTSSFLLSESKMQI